MDLEKRKTELEELYNDLDQRKLVGIILELTIENIDLKKQLSIHGVVKSLPSKEELVLNAEKYVSANKDTSPFDVGVDAYIKGFTEGLKINYKDLPN